MVSNYTVIPNTGITELNFRADVAECKFYSLSRNLFNMKINIKTRTEMLNSLVRSRMLYSCQTWCCTKTQLTHINAVTIMSQNDAPGEKQKIVGAREQRITALISHILLGKGF